MSNDLHNQIRSTIRRALYGTLGIPMLALPVALAQQTTNQIAAANTQQPVKMEKTVVTGSLIPTAETVGPAPVDLATAETITRLGSADVLHSLKKFTPSLGGNVNVGQEVNNGGFGESNVGIRNLRTLVLLNGRRLGNSSFSNGALVDLNTVPLAAIDRIEVLKDGASALYGSEAIGGVVNIITKKDYTGVEIGGRFGAATGDGTYYEYQASLVGGSANEHSSFTAAAQYYHQDALKTIDRKGASLGFDELRAHNIDPNGVSYISPSFAGKVQEGGSGASFLLNPVYNTPPVFPGHSFSGPTAVADYNAYAVSQNMAAPYLSVGGAHNRLNTTLYGTDTIQSQDRRNVSGTGSHDIFEKRMQVFGEFLFANIDSEGVLAPSPVVGLGTKQANIDIPANNPYNPFGIALGPSAGASGLPPGGPRIRSRFVDSGNRLFDAQTDYYHIVSGLKGDFDNGYGYNAAYNYNRYDQVQFTKNAINGAALDLALQPNGQTDPVTGLPLSKLPGTGPLNVPVYNIFAGSKDAADGRSRSGQNNAATLEGIRTTLFQTGKSEEWDAIGSITGTPFDLPGGKLAFAVGGGFTSEALSVDFDGLTRIGKVPGLNAALPTHGRRDSWAGFIEVRIPITGPDMNIPGLRSLEVTAAGRYESFDPGGDSKVPKVGLRWQPLDEQVTLRGTYSQSFVAPTTFQLFGGTAVNVPAIAVPAITGDGTSLAFTQEYTSNLSNKDLKPVDAENYGFGIVFSPKFIKGLTLSVDYYHIKTKNDIFRVSQQDMVNDLNANGSNSKWVTYFSKADGSRITTPGPWQASDADWGNLQVPLLNGAEQKTHGLDLAASYNLPTDNYGALTFYANANVLFDYKYKDPVVGGPFPYNGQYTDAAEGTAGAQGTLPDYIINTGVTWEYPIRKDSVALTVSATYIPEVRALGSLHQSNLAFEAAFDDLLNDFTLDGSTWKVESWYKIDMQLSYELGKHKETKDWYDATRLTIGCNNITDNKPPLIAGAFEDNTDKSTYDILGRFVYFEVSKKF